MWNRCILPGKQPQALSPALVQGASLLDYDGLRRRMSLRTRAPA